MSDASVLRHTLIGASALLLWSTLAVTTVFAGGVPPFLMVGFAFFIAFLIGLAKWVIRGESILGHMRQPWQAWALGVCGLFGYHALVFYALQAAPPLEANLVNYLWPLCIVLFSGFLPGHRLRWFHLAGTLSGLIGVILLVTGGGAVSFSAEALPGYLAALGAAITWGAYSVLSRLMKAVPTDSVAAFCLVGSLLAFVCHALFETGGWPQTPVQWGAVILLGLGPAGGAFFLWDLGMKRGDIQVLGALSYATPLMSTLLLILTGSGALSPMVAVACLMIVGGAALASKDMLFGKKKAAAAAE